MNSAQLISELSKFPADMLVGQSYYFDRMNIENDRRVVFDHGGDQPSITVGEAIEFLTQHASKPVWFMDDESPRRLFSISKIDYMGEPYIRFYGYY